MIKSTPISSPSLILTLSKLKTVYGLLQSWNVTDDMLSEIVLSYYPEAVEEIVMRDLLTRGSNSSA